MGGIGGLGGLDLTALGLPGEAAYVDAYCRRTGREKLIGFDYYIVFNMFRFAAIRTAFAWNEARRARGVAR